ncbi:MAG TPA: nucleotidyltransferase domain-containing protein [Solirubrobacterales bacterium]|nr:nucleotidyltransferase domain-containing protein [Solirubrobacterales bacterium]
MRDIYADLGSRCPINCGVSRLLRYRVGMASRDLIDKAGMALMEAAGANAKVILFGSYARGEEKSDSDFDFLVIEPEVDDHFGESVRLAKLVGELGVPADVVVASQDHVREWGGLPGTMLHDALSEGKIIGSRAA